MPKENLEAKAGRYAAVLPEGPPGEELQEAADPLGIEHGLPNRCRRDRSTMSAASREIASRMPTSSR